MTLNIPRQGELLSADELVEILRPLRQKGAKVVFTNGCFDILHRGHVTYLNNAKELGDVLVLGLNSDASVKRQNKGPERPICNQVERAAVIGGLRAVDYVVLFDEDTPFNLIAKILPDVLVKGGDWTPDKIVGRDVVEANGGRVLSIPFVEGNSTTGIVERILKSAKPCA